VDIIDKNRKIVHEAHMIPGWQKDNFDLTKLEENIKSKLKINVDKKCLQDIQVCESELAVLLTLTKSTCNSIESDIYKALNSVQSLLPPNDTADLKNAYIFIYIMLNLMKNTQVAPFTQANIKNQRGEAQPIEQKTASLPSLTGVYKPKSESITGVNPGYKAKQNPPLTPQSSVSALTENSGNPPPKNATTN